MSAKKKEKGSVCREKRVCGFVPGPPLPLFLSSLLLPVPSNTPLGCLYLCVDTPPKAQNDFTALCAKVPLLFCHPSCVAEKRPMPGEKGGS
jgi:hypothetical protein